jgi:hypothetical protein
VQCERCHRATEADERGWVAFLPPAERDASTILLCPDCVGELLREQRLAGDDEKGST